MRVRILKFEAGTRTRGYNPWATLLPGEVFVATKEGIAEPSRSVTYKHLNPFRRSLPGFSAKNVSVLSIQGRLADERASPVTLRLDSGADLTLMSEQYYRSLPDPPPLRKGMKLKLWQLTSSENRLLGYVSTKVFVEDDAGKPVSFDVEAYVVSEMTVPILLGEDFHRNYSLTVQRSLNSPTLIKVGNLKHSFSATPAAKGREAYLVSRSKDAEAVLDKYRTHRRKTVRKKKKAVASLKLGQVIRAADTVTIPPHTTKKVLVAGNLGDSKSWLVE